LKLLVEGHTWSRGTDAKHSTQSPGQSFTDRLWEEMGHRKCSLRGQSCRSSAVCAMDWMSQAVARHNGVTHWRMAKISGSEDGIK
jgi:hypothetical protein